MRRQQASGDELQFVVFRVGSRELALSIVQVERILRYEPPEPWSDAPAFLEGLVPFGGGRVPLLDLRRRMGTEPTSREETRILVLAVEGLPLAVVADAVSEVLRVDTRTIQPPAASLTGFPAEALSGMIERDGRRILILNVARLLTQAERLALTEAAT
ncbi:MAG TPA: chemotaxis protein CheW [Gemmatimonadales bacterium]|jgi:purine-binding chemotaxis protein CheW